MFKHHVPRIFHPPTPNGLPVLEAAYTGVTGALPLHQPALTELLMEHTSNNVSVNGDTGQCEPAETVRLSMSENVLVLPSNLAVVWLNTEY